jgi:hypothetical protein
MHATFNIKINLYKKATEMGNRRNWTCLHCNHHVTIGDDDCSSDAHTLNVKNTEGQVTLYTNFRVCPNPDCQKFSMNASLYKTKYVANSGLRVVDDTPLYAWNLVPFGVAKVFPDYIPRALRTDYTEACAIAGLSPKAAATLCRRCLQGMVRDFWEVETKSNRLWDELKEIKDKVDPGVWGAIIALKDLGNIGAHMELDVDVMTDVDSGEAELLIELIESLFEDWYIQRHTRNARNTALIAAAAAKKDGGSKS